MEGLAHLPPTHSNHLRQCLVLIWGPQSWSSGICIYLLCGHGVEGYRCYFFFLESIVNHYSGVLNLNFNAPSSKKQWRVTVEEEKGYRKELFI